MMLMKKKNFIIFVTLCLLIDSIDAGWKFWKSKKDEIPSTTAIPAVPTGITASSSTVGPVLSDGISGKDIPKAPAVGQQSQRQTPGPKPLGTSTKRPTGALLGPDIALSPPQDPFPPLPSVQAPNSRPTVTTSTANPSRTSIPTQKPTQATISTPGAGSSGVTPSPRPLGPKPLGTSTKKPTGSLLGPGIALSPPQDPFPPLPSVQAPNSRPTVTPSTANPSWTSVPTQKPAHKVTTSTQKPTQANSGSSLAGVTSSPRTTTPVIHGTKPPTAAPRPETPSRNNIYSKNPKYSPGNNVTDEDLEKLSEAMYLLDKSNIWQHVSVNLQKKSKSNSLVDESPQPLLVVKPAALELETVDKVRKIYDNYQLDTKINEYLGVTQRQEETDLINKFLSTDLMSAAMNFLAKKKKVTQSFDEYQALLRRLWFRLYSRGDGKIGSTGFEHVFLAEIRNRAEILGLHNWIYFNAEEQKGRANYLGYMKQLKLNDKISILSFHTLFDGINKPVTSMFIGTSPEMEMALYTVCFMVRPNQECRLSLGGTKFKINTFKMTYRGSNMIGSAYPRI